MERYERLMTSILVDNSFQKLYTIITEKGFKTNNQEVLNFIKAFNSRFRIYAEKNEYDEMMLLNRLLSLMLQKVDWPDEIDKEVSFNIAALVVTVFGRTYSKHKFWDDIPGYIAETLLHLLSTYVEFLDIKFNMDSNLVNAVLNKAVILFRYLTDIEIKPYGKYSKICLKLAFAVDTCANKDEMLWLPIMMEEITKNLLQLTQLTEKEREEETILKYAKIKHFSFTVMHKLIIRFFDNNTLDLHFVTRMFNIICDIRKLPKPINKLFEKEVSMLIKTISYGSRLPQLVNAICDSEEVSGITRENQFGLLLRIIDEVSEISAILQKHEECLLRIIHEILQRIDEDRDLLFPEKAHELYRSTIIILVTITVKSSLLENQLFPRIEQMFMNTLFTGNFFKLTIMHYIWVLLFKRSSPWLQESYFRSFVRIAINENLKATPIEAYECIITSLIDEYWDIIKDDGEICTDELAELYRKSKCGTIDQKISITEKLEKLKTLPSQTAYYDLVNSLAAEKSIPPRLTLDIIKNIELNMDNLNVTSLINKVMETAQLQNSELLKDIDYILDFLEKAGRSNFITLLSRLWTLQPNRNTEQRSRDMRLFIACHFLKDTELLKRLIKHRLLNKSNLECKELENVVHDYENYQKPYDLCHKHTCEMTIKESLFCETEYNIAVLANMLEKEITELDRARIKRLIKDLREILGFENAIL